MYFKPSSKFFIGAFNLAVIGCFVSLVSGCVIPEYRTSSRSRAISGRVLDASSKRPLGGVDVSFIGDSSIHSATRSDGTFDVAATRNHHFIALIGMCSVDLPQGHVYNDVRIFKHGYFPAAVDLCDHTLVDNGAGTNYSGKLRLFDICLTPSQGLVREDMTASGLMAFAKSVFSVPAPLVTLRKARSIAMRQINEYVDVGVPDDKSDAYLEAYYLWNHELDATSFRYYVPDIISYLIRHRHEKDSDFILNMLGALDGPDRVPLFSDAESVVILSTLEFLCMDEYSCVQNYALLSMRSYLSLRHVTSK